MAQRQKEADSSNSSQGNCDGKFSIENEFIARSASFFGNRDIRMLWQESNFVASKTSWIVRGKFDFLELVEEDESEEVAKSVRTILGRTEKKVKSAGNNNCK